MVQTLQNNQGKISMSNADIAKELSELRAQIEELRLAGKPEQKDQQPQSDEPSEQSTISDSDTASIQRALAGKMGIGDAEAQIQEFMTALEEDIKDTKPMTMLVVFALGVLIGRLLPK